MAALLFQISNSAVTTSLLCCPLVIPVPIHGSLTSTTHILVFYRNMQIFATLKSFEGYVVNS